jgi:hypothetical protein
VNLKFDVQRVGLNLCKSGLGATYRARVSWIEHERRILKTHLSSLRPTLVRCGLRTLKKRFIESWVEALDAFALALDRPDSPKSNEENLYKIAHLTRLSTGSLHVQLPVRKVSLIAIFSRRRSISLLRVEAPRHRWTLPSATPTTTTTSGALDVHGLALRR